MSKASTGQTQGMGYLCDTEMSSSNGTQKQRLATLSGLLVWVLLGISFLLSACMKDVVYEKQYRFEDAIWTAGDTLWFDFEIEDTTVYHDLKAALRIDTEYPFSNLYLLARIQGSQGQDITEMKGFELADKTGKWKGKSYSGLISFELPLKERFVFQRSGSYKVYLIQYMRKDQLPGIHDVGIKLTKGDPLL
ncbi:MAG: gliding motility lipoprotein GldH [Flavobacteriales bacterium]|nr:gliding motility lipoprotein GldH [Flavobacteriales bacterium]